MIGRALSNHFGGSVIVNFVTKQLCDYSLVWERMELTQMPIHACTHILWEYMILFVSRYQLELKEEYIARTKKVSEDEKKNKGNHLSEIDKVPVYL